MITVTIHQHRLEHVKIRSYHFKHSAVTWLLLSGFLPTEDPLTYTNTMTGETATINKEV